MNFEMINEDLYSVTDCLSMTDFLLLDDEFNCRYNNWYFSKKESDRPDWYPSRGFLEKNQTDDWNLGYNFQLIRIGTTVKLHCEYLLKKKFFFKRVHTNIQFFGQESTFHQDSDKRESGKDWSFLIFVDSDWNSEHGGDFICELENGKYKNIPFIPNNGALFNSALQHRGAAPNSLCLYKPRKTIQFLFEEID